MSKYVKGDYTRCYEDICEIWYEDNLYCVVRTDDADKIIRVLNENKQLMKENQELRMSPRVDVNEIESLVCENEKLKSELEESKKAHSNCDKLWWELHDEKEQLEKENEQLKQFPIKLDNRIQKLEESLKALREMEDDDLNPQAVEDVATVIAMSLNALLEFKKELKGDVE